MNGVDFNLFRFLASIKHFLKTLSLRQCPSLHAGVRSSTVEMAAALMLVTSATTILTAPTDPTRKDVVGYFSVSHNPFLKKLKYKKRFTRKMKRCFYYDM